MGNISGTDETAICLRTLALTSDEPGSPWLCIPALDLTDCVTMTVVAEIAVLTLPTSVPPGVCVGVAAGCVIAATLQ